MVPEGTWRRPIRSEIVVHRVKLLAEIIWHRWTETGARRKRIMYCCGFINLLLLDYVALFYWLNIFKKNLFSLEVVFKN